MILRRLSFLFLLGLFVSPLQAQKLNYFKGTFAEAMAAAKKQHKLIFLVAQKGAPAGMSSRINVDKEVAARFNAKFICLYDSLGTATGLKEIYQRYNVSPYYAALYLDEEGGLLLKSMVYINMTPTGLAEMDKAIQRSQSKTLTRFDQEYKKGDRNLGFLRDFLSKFDELDIPVDQALLEQYCSLLPVSALDDYETIVFILEKGPVLSGTAYKITRVNPKLTDSLYKTLSEARRSKINKKVVDATMTAAKARRDESMAMVAANYASAIRRSDWQKAGASYSLLMMEFYQSTKDTSKFLNIAVEYYQQYYLTLRDSIHTEDVPEMRPPLLPLTAQNIDTAKGAAVQTIKTIEVTVSPPPSAEEQWRAERTRKSITTADSIQIVSGTIRRISSLSDHQLLRADSLAQQKLRKFLKGTEFASTLNNGAWQIFEMKTTNPVLLSKAVIWVQRSTELFPENSAYFDTLAHLYYRQKNYDKAISTQQKAIDAINKRAAYDAALRARINQMQPDQKPLTDFTQQQVDRYTVELNKMKQKSL